MANDLVVGGLDVVGDDVEGAHHLNRHHGGGGRRVATPPWMRNATTQGVSIPQEELDPLPFESVVLSGGEGGIAAGATGFLLAEPQRPFRGERIILGALFDTPADAGNAVVVDPAIYVGAVQIGSAQGGMPFAAYAATAFGVRLSFPAAGQGTKIKVFFRVLVAIGAGVNLALTGVCIGRAVR